MTERRYMVIPTTALGIIDFEQVLATSAATMRYSVDGSQTFVKWDGAMPDFLAEIPGAQGPYDHETILAILATPAWTPEGGAVV